MQRLFAQGIRALLLVVVVAGAAGAAASHAAVKANVYIDPAGRCHKNTPCVTTVQAGIQAASAGQVVLVYGGTYREHVVLDKALTLTGDGPGAKLDGSGTGTVLTIATGGATVSKLTIANGESGVALQAASGNQLSGLRISNVGRGISFAWGSTGNTVADTDVAHATYGIDVGDTGNSGNQFLRLKLHDNGTGLNAYAGSDGLLLEDSTIAKNGTGVQVGWSGGWTVQDNEIRENSGPGIVTDTVWSGSIVHDYIARNGQDGIYEAGYFSTVSTHDNRIEANGLAGIDLAIGAQSNDVHHNMVVGNLRYGVQIPSHPYWNGGNSITGNFVFAGTGALGDALDDNGGNTWSGNFYSLDTPWGSPFTILGAAGAQDAGPLTQADLPKPAAKSDCKKNGWWLLTNGTAPFKNEAACTAYLK